MEGCSLSSKVMDTVLPFIDFSFLAADVAKWTNYNLQINTKVFFVDLTSVLTLMVLSQVFLR